MEQVQAANSGSATGKTTTGSETAVILASDGAGRAFRYFTTTGEVFSNKAFCIHLFGHFWFLFWVSTARELLSLCSYDALKSGKNAGQIRGVW
jgi:hypothetical protein